LLFVCHALADVDRIGSVDAEEYPTGFGDLIAGVDFLKQIVIM
jgi:hypothetical protein